MLYFIQPNELAFRVVDSSYGGIVQPGVHLAFSFAGKAVAIERIAPHAGPIQHRLIRHVLDDPAAERLIQKVHVPDGSRGLYWIDETFSGFLLPGLYGFFKGPARVRVQVLEAVPGQQVQAVDVESLLRHATAGAFLDVITVEQGTAASLEQAGRDLGIFGPGRYVFLKTYSPVRARVVSVREASLDVQGQEIMTLDKVSIRLNLVVGYKVVDAVRALDSGQQPHESVYRAAQLALRASVASRTLESLLADRQSLAGELTEPITRDVQDIGVAVTRVVVRDIILPGEMRTLFNRVIEAQKEAEANIIRRREETAAARSQANTARLYQENPMLLKLREMELVSKALAEAKVKLVVGAQDVTGKVMSLLNADDKPQKPSV